MDCNLCQQLRGFSPQDIKGRIIETIVLYLLTDCVKGFGNLFDQRYYENWNCWNFVVNCSCSWQELRASYRRNFIVKGWKYKWLEAGQLRRWLHEIENLSITIRIKVFERGLQVRPIIISERYTAARESLQSCPPVVPCRGISVISKIVPKINLSNM